VMGRAEGSPGNSPDESPVTRVFFSKPFWFGATEVTVAQWRQFVDATGYRTDAEKGGGLFVANGSGAKGIDGWAKRAGLSWRSPGREQTDAHPVVGVSWSDAQAFCAWLTQREKTAGRLPTGYAFSLPTEAQWEYACRAGSEAIFASGDTLDPEYGVSGETGTKNPLEVGSRKPNAWGFHDMHGNVWEWCADGRRQLTESPVTDPTTANETSKERMVRGGSFRQPTLYARSNFRNYINKSAGMFDFGFRVAVQQ
jgi:sulfatase modifying factor 1